MSMGQEWIDEHLYEYDIEERIEDEARRGVWTTKDGTQIPVEDMETRYDERVSQEDMDRVYEQGYKKGYEDGVGSERPRAFGAGYAAGYNNASKLVRCKECIYNTLNTDGEAESWCYKHGIDIESDDYCSFGERKESEE